LLVTDPVNARNRLIDDGLRQLDWTSDHEQCGQSNKHYRKAHIALLVHRADIRLSTQLDLIVI
jgi:hypothetical protein